MNELTPVITLDYQTPEEEAAERAAATRLVRRHCRDAELMLDYLGLGGNQ